MLYVAAKAVFRQLLKTVRMSIKSFLRELRTSRKQRQRLCRGPLTSPQLLENRLLLTSPTVDLNGSDDSGIDFAATFTEGGGAVLLQEADLTSNAGTVVTRQPGSEFQVNTETANFQTIGINGRGRYVASDATGNHVVVWMSLAQDGHAYGIFGQRYDTNGAPVGDEFQVNTTTSDHQINPSLTMDDAGNFLVVWEGNGPGDSTGVFGQRFSADGIRVGGEFLIPSSTSGSASSPVASMNGDGDFVVVWSNSEVYGQRFLADGSRVGSEFLVNPTQSGGQAAVAMDDGGGFFVAWASNNASSNVFARRYAPDGTALTDEVMVNTFTDSQQNYVAVDIDAVGNSVVTWNSRDQDDYFGQDRDGVYGQRFDSIGSPVGEEFRVTTNLSQDKRYSSVAMDSVGNFVVTWSSYFQDGSYYGVYGQRFHADGTRAGDEFLINETTDDDQQNPSVDLLDNGDFLTVWLNEPAPGEREVFGRYFRSATGLIDKATVTITNRLDGANELLTVDTSGTSIVADYRNGLLTLSGVDSESNYQQVLRTVRYENTSEDPNTTDRQVEFAVRVAEFDSVIATSTLTVSAVNDLPEVAVSGSTAVTVGEGQLAAVSGTFSDVDSDDVVLTTSIGNVVANNNGTWVWEFVTSHDPAENGTVTITATDTEGDATTATFDLSVNPLPFDFGIDRWEDNRESEPDTVFGHQVITLGDVNGDGVIDRAISTSYGTSGTYVLLMNADGTVQSRTRVAPLHTSGALASAGDIDGDGIEELAVGNATTNSGGSVTLFFLNPDGSIRESSRIESGAGGFGASVVAIGDLNNDGVNDIAIGASRFSVNEGAVYVYFMNSDGTVASSTTIGNNVGGGPSLSIARMGISLANMGDINGDGVTDLAVGAYYYGVGNAVRRSGAVFVLMMNPDGTAQSVSRLSRDTGIPVESDGGFGRHVVSAGDVDGNGVNDLAVGVLPVVAADAGAVYLVLMNADGTSSGIREFSEGAFGSPTGADGITPIPYFYDRFLSNLGDLDGNGIDELWVSTLRSSTTHLLYMTNGVVRADSSSVTITEGQTASNTGTFVDPGDGSVTLSASVGTVTATGAGVWSWSLPTTDGPLAAPFVDIFLTNAAGDVDSVRFHLDVQNVAPTITDLQFDTSAIDEGGSVVLTGQFTDPGTDDTHTVTVDWGDGSRDVIADITTTSFSLSHTYLDDPYSGSAEGSYQVLVSVVDDDGGQTATVDAAAGSTQRVSVASDGSEAALAAGNFAISGDGRYVTFASSATNLVPNDTNAKTDSFVHDRVTGLTRRISVASDGSEANDHSGPGGFSGDGRYVVFESRASNLVPGDTNNTTDIFIHDLQIGVTRRVSVATDGTQANGFSSLPAISANGQYVTFESFAYNLVPGDTNIQKDIFVHNLQTGITELASVASDGTQGNDWGQRPSISADGRYVSFDTGASNLVTDDTNGEFDVFVRDRLTGTTVRASVSSTGIQSDRDALRSQISGDGRHVVFYSNATTLVTETFSRTQVFLHDLTTGQTELVSVDDSGDPADGNSGYPQPTVSHDGRFVAFLSEGKNLIEADTNNRPDVFVRDRINGTTEHVSLTNDGTQSTGRPTSAAIAANGLVVAFSSDGSDLVTDDTNGTADIFVRGLGQPGLAPPELLVRNLEPVLTTQEDEAIEAYDWAVLSREITFADVGINDVHTVTIDYGDGSTPQLINVPLGERSVSIDHVYVVTSGETVSWPVTIQVADDDSGTGYQSFNVSVTDKALTAPDDRPTLQFAETSYTVTEGGGQVVAIQATLSAAATEPIEVSAVLLDGSATRNVDYSLEDTVFVFAVGQSVAEVSFTDIDDQLDEASTETATLTFATTLSGVVVGANSQTTLQVLDDDQRPTVYFKERSSEPTEGDEYKLSVELSALSASEVQIPLVVSHGTADTDDYTLTNTMVVIPPGERTGAVTLSIADDTLPEPTESFTVNIDDAVIGADRRSTPGTPLSHVVKIQRSDTLVADLSVSTTSLSEKAVGGINATFEVTVTLDAPALTNLSIPIVVTSRDATDPQDYSGLTTITIAEGEDSGSGTITIEDDTLSESTETLQISLGHGLPNGVIRGSRTNSSVRIQDDDRPTIQFTTRRQYGYEDAGSMVVTVTTGGVTFTQDYYVPVIVRPKQRSAYYNGSNADLEGSTSIRIKAGESTGSISVSPVDDSKNEVREDFDFILGSVSSIPGAVRGARRTHTVHVQDDDPIASISVAERSVSEGASSNIKFVVRLSAATNQKVRIPFNVYGIAKRNADYTIIETTQSNYRVSRNYVDINPGKTAAVIQVRINGDDIVEDAERMGIKLVSKYGSLRLSNAQIGERYADSLVINSTDGPPVPRISVVRGRPNGSKSYSSTSSWINEGGSFRVTVTIPKAASKNLYVPISFPAGSGRASTTDKTIRIFGSKITVPNKDFLTRGLSNGKLKIPAGKTSASFYIDTVNDSREEPNEKIRITMGQPVDSSGRNFGKLPKTNYKFVGIRSSDTKTYSSSATGGTLGIDGTGQVYDAPGIGGTTANGTSTYTNTKPTTGNLAIWSPVGGYRVGSTTFLDGNFNGVRDFLDLDGNGLQSDTEPDEPSGLTLDDGTVQLTIPAEFDRNGNDVIDVGEAQFVSVGGVDISTGLAQQARLVAAPGDYLATPLTTLSAKLVQEHGFTLEDAHTRVLEAMSLPFFEMGQTAVLHATLAGDFNAASSYPASVSLENTAVVMAHYLDGATGLSVEYFADLVYEQLAVGVSAPDAFTDLANSVFLENLIVDVGAAFGVGDVTTEVTALADRLAAINAATMDLPVTPDLPFLEEVIRRKIVARGAMATDAGFIAAGTLPITDFTNRYSGQPLEDAIAAAQPGIIVPVGIVVSDAEVIEGNDGTTFAEFTIAVSEHFNEPLTVDYATIDRTALDENGDGEQDYESTSGSVTFQPGEATSQTIRVAIFGDTLAELDEEFEVQLFNPTYGILQRSIGRGVIRADDAIVVQLDSAPDGSDVIIEVDGDAVSIYQDGDLRLDGSLHIGAPLQVVSAAGGQTRFLVNLLSPTTEGRSIQLTSGDEQDTLHFRNAASSVTERLKISDENGQLAADGLTLNYEGFATATDDQSPLLQFVGTPAINVPLQLNVALPEFVNAEEVVYTWSVKLGDEAPSEFTGSLVEFTPPASGEYEVTVQAELIDGALGIARQSFTLEGTGATAVIDSLTTDAVEIGDKAAGETVTLTAALSDFSAASLPAMTIRWGDGSTDPANISSTGAIVNTHTYADGGVYTVTLSFDDGDGESASTEVLISGVGVQDGVLNVVGSAGLDQVILQRRSGASYLIRSNTLGTHNVSPAAFTSVYVQLGDGNDRFNALGNFEVPLIVDAGAGNDRLVGSRGGDVLLGGEGNDYIWAGSGNNIVIGGTGRDFIFGGSGTDLLIAGTTKFDQDSAALRKLQAEWTSERSVQQRIANLYNGSGSTNRLNEDNFLTVGTEGSVQDDDERDLLFGGGSMDWLFYDKQEDIAYGTLGDLLNNDLDDLFND